MVVIFVTSGHMNGVRTGGRGEHKPGVRKCLSSITSLWRGWVRRTGKRLTNGDSVVLVCEIWNLKKGLFFTFCVQKKRIVKCCYQLLLILEACSSDQCWVSGVSFHLRGVGGRREEWF